MHETTKHINGTYDLCQITLPVITALNRRSLQRHFGGSGSLTDETKTFSPGLAASLSEVSLTISTEKISAAAAYQRKAGYRWKS
jgi:hypothetical protein